MSAGKALKAVNAALGRGGDWLFEYCGNIFLVALVAVLFGLIAWVGVVTFMNYHSPTFELTKSDWTCSSTYEVRRFNGKFWYTTTECAQWSRETK